MDLGNILKNQPVAAAVSVPKQGFSEEDEVLEFAEHETFNMPLLLLWIAAIVAVLATGFFWFLNNSAIQEVAEKQAEKDEVVSEILSSTYIQIEQKASAFKSAVTQLQQYSSNRYLVGEFIPAFSTKVNKNVVVNNISLSSEGKVAMDGITNSYKSAAEQLATLKEWKINTKNVFKSAELTTVSEDISDGVKVRFVISGQVDKTISLKTVPVVSSSATEGTTNAEVQ